MNILKAGLAALLSSWVAMYGVLSCSETPWNTQVATIVGSGRFGDACGINLEKPRCRGLQPLACEEKAMHNHASAGQKIAIKSKGHQDIKCRNKIQDQNASERVGDPLPETSTKIKKRASEWAIRSGR
ncbi:unnamed protein product [Aphanomyces euteiches]